MASYNLSRLVYLIARKVNAVNVGGTVPTNTSNDIIDNIDDMVQGWQADGLRLWAQQDLTLTMVASQASYAIGTSGTPDLNTARPKRILSARLNTTSSGNDQILTQLSREEYNMLSNKTQTGTPNSFYYDPQLPNANLYLWLVPDSTAASTQTVILTAQVPLDTIGYTTTSLTFPPEWFQALKWGGAAEMLADFPVPAALAQEIKSNAEFYRMKLEDWDQEEASTRFSMDNQ